MKTTAKPKINPLSRVPRQQRLVMAVRGGAGVGKSHFIRSLSEAGLGKLCIFDTERKSRLLKGVGVTFDALEIEHPDELPEFIDWALTGEGTEQNYGCYALDSWAAYFGAKHSEMLEAVRAETGDPLAQPSAEQLAADQMILQSVLRKLCIESGKSVVIADQIPARGKEAKEDNEIGRVLPMTASGLEYFVDVMVEVSLQERDGEIVRVFQVVKSNSPAFEVGFELTGNVTFKDFLDHMRGEEALNLAFENPAPSVVPEFIEDKSPISIAPPQMTIDELVAKAEANGFKRADIVTGAKIYHNQPNIYHLTAEQIADLDRRITAKIEKNQTASNEAVIEEKPAGKKIKAA
ncbi:MAG: ATP-binding protein [Acidobacteriota bacterium]|nr:ATP-binding protein [Acidobacteriota bacterium]